MKILPDSFTESGFVHELLERTGDVAVYRRFKTGGGPEHFEVIRVARHNGFKIANSIIPPAETYPPASQWGTNGWTYPDKEAARVKAHELMLAEAAK